MTQERIYCKNSHAKMNHLQESLKNFLFFLFSFRFVFFSLIFITHAPNLLYSAKLQNLGSSSLISQLQIPLKGFWSVKEVSGYTHVL